MLGLLGMRVWVGDLIVVLVCWGLVVLRAAESGWADCCVIMATCSLGGGGGDDDLSNCS